MYPEKQHPSYTHCINNKQKKGLDLGLGGYVLSLLGSWEAKQGVGRRQKKMDSNALVITKGNS